MAQPKKGTPPPGRPPQQTHPAQQYQQRAPQQAPPVQRAASPARPAVGQTAVATVPPPNEERQIEYVPLGAAGPIKLSFAMVRDMLAISPDKNKTYPGDDDVFKFMALCKTRALNPFDGDCWLIGYYSTAEQKTKWNLVTGVQAFYKRAELNEKYDGIESGVIVRTATGEVLDREGDFLFDDDFLLGSWATVHVKGRAFPSKERLAFKIFDQGQARWKKDPAGMIVKCAEASALRKAFPNSLGGLMVREEMLEAYQQQPPPRIEATATLVIPPELPPNGRNAARPGKQSQPQQQPADPGPEYQPGPVEGEVTDQAGDQVEQTQPPGDGNDKVSPATSLKLRAKIGEVKLTDDELRGLLSQKGVASLNDLTENQAQICIAELSEPFSE